MKKTAEESPERVPQPHGGELLKGGKKGNRGGSGRPSNLIRQRCADSIDTRIAIAEAIADDATLRPSDRLAALSLIAKFAGLDVLAYDPYEAEDERQMRLKTQAQRLERDAELEAIFPPFRL